MSLPTGLLSFTVAEHRQIYGHTRMATFLTHASADAHVGSQSSGTPRSLCRLPVKWNSTTSSSGISTFSGTVALRRRTEATSLGKAPLASRRCHLRQHRSPALSACRSMHVVPSPARMRVFAGYALAGFYAWSSSPCLLASLQITIH